MIRTLVFMVLCLVTLSVGAATETYPLENEQQRDRFRELTGELRCPKCQNQSIADSNAPIANDMRDRVHEMILQGRSNDEIMSAMVSRFGDFVRYQPELEPRTWLLWATPLLAVLVGVSVIAIIVIRSRRNSAGNEVLSETDRRRAEELLNDRSSDRG